METYELIFTIAIGLLVLLFGFRLKRIAFFVIWFLIGYVLMHDYIMGFINSSVPEIATNSIYQLLLPIGGGVIMALLGFTIEKLCVSSITFAAVMLITINYFGTELLTLGIGAVVGVILGAFAVRMIKPATIIATSGIGAYALTLAVFELFKDLNHATFYFPILIVLMAIGVFFQFGASKRVHY